jgi:pseudaminic acid cytidylyltransferase
VHIAVIPARGGSKRIPGKNIKNFYGTPMLQATIEKTLYSGIFDSIYVSTEDVTITQLAVKCGAKIVTRENHLSDDYATTIDVIHAAVTQLHKVESSAIDFVTCVYPVTPFLAIDHLRRGLEILWENSESYVFAVQDQSTQVGRSFRINKKDKLEKVFPTQEQMRTQDLPTIYSDAGLFYMGPAKNWLSRTPLFSPNSKFVKIGKYESIDIDTEEDWKFAEELYKIRNRTKEK